LVIVKLKLYEVCLLKIIYFNLTYAKVKYSDASSRARTYDLSVNSRMLFQLSYGSVYYNTTSSLCGFKRKLYNLLFVRFGQ
jgi:uncharacterized membrane protein